MHTCIDRGNSEVEAIINPFFLKGNIVFWVLVFQMHGRCIELDVWG
jgi:hypothetical protein